MTHEEYLNEPRDVIVWDMQLAEVKANVEEALMERARLEQERKQRAGG